ncbi:MAG TPA: SDR family oxidoreductase [Allocoleopsis sp.]
MSKCAIITGGTRGIGFGISQALAFDGYNLILGFNANEQAAQKAKTILESTYQIKVHTVKGDVTSAPTIEQIFQCLEDDEMGQLTALVHNAGLWVGGTTKIDSIQAQEAANIPDQVLANGTFSTFIQYDYYQNVYPKCFINCVEKALNYMQDGNGYIVAISAVGCNLLQKPMLGYDMPGPAKAAMEYLTRYYAKKLTSRKITVNTVIPGFTKTETWDFFADKYGRIESEVMQKRIANTPMQRWLLPEEIGKVVAFLCSPQAALITGVAIPVDGGLHLS